MRAITLKKFWNVTRAGCSWKVFKPESTYLDGTVGIYSVLRMQGGQLMVHIFILMVHVFIFKLNE